MDTFYTIYVTDKGMKKAEAGFMELEDEVTGREIGFGAGYVNVHTADKAIVDKAIEWIGRENVLEVAGPGEVDI